MSELSRNFIVCIFFLPSLGMPAALYQMKWKLSGLPFEVRTLRAPLSDKSRIAESGVVKPETKLTLNEPLPNGEIKLGPSERAIIYLIIKNKSNKKYRFSVSPHSTEPGSSALGFHFNCLCNGHIYEVGPKEIWYRIMELKVSDVAPEGKIILEHKIFPVSNDSKRKPQDHHHHM